MAISIQKNLMLEMLEQHLPRPKAKQIYDQGKELPNKKERERWYLSIIDMVRTRSVKPIAPYLHYKHQPVDFKTFVEDPAYMNSPKIIYPKIMDELEELNSGRYVEAVLTGAIGAGKCLGKGTPVLLFDGSIKPVETIVVGDVLMGPDSGPRMVISTTSGEEELFEVSQLGGDNYIVNKSHILSLQYTGTKQTGKATRYGKCKGDIENICIEDYLALSNNHRNLLKGWKPEAITFSSVPVYDPYLLGLWLGDGTSDDTSFTSMDNEIVSYLQLVAKREGLLLLDLEDKRGNKAKRYSLRTYEGKVPGSNKIRNWLQHSSLLGNKHIPHDYLTASIEARRLLLAGLIDTDGSLSNGGYEITQKRENIANGICFIGRSLGFRVRKISKVINGITYYRCYISGDVSTIPVRLPHKKASPRKKTKSVNRWGVSVKSIGHGKYYGFELSGADRLFLLGDFTVTHNTTMALWTQAYQLYLLSCYENPHAVFQLDDSSEILIVFQSISASLAKAVDYARFRSMIEKSPYFQRVFPFAREIQSELRFPNRIIVKPVSGSSTAAIGQNVIGGILDELNFMAVVERSKQSDDGGTYDQAIANYNAIVRRRKSRFMKQGILPGILCLVSSKRYPGQFTDHKQDEQRKEIAKYGHSTIYVYDKCTWEVMQEGSFSGKWFKVFAGTETKKPRILEGDDYNKLTAEEQGLTKDIPMEYREDFEKDIMNALRDIAGISTLAKHPFFLNLDKVAEAFGTTPNVLSKVRSTLAPGDLVEAAKTFKNPTSPRFAHIDLAVTGDCAGLVIGHVEKFVQIQRGNEYETWPKFVIDLVLEVPPPPGGEILFYRIREVLYALRDSVKMPIQWVTFDSFQSRDSMQVLRQKGFATGMQSMDTSNDPYEFLKGAFYDGRIEIPECEKLRKEIAGLEKDARLDKVDHPPHGSKDIADALAGVVYGLSMRREIWAHHGVSLRMIPSWLNRKSIKTSEEKGEHTDTSKIVKLGSDS